MPGRWCGSAETSLYWRQVRALLWKNLLLKRASARNALTTIFEVCIPLLVAYILVTIHSSTEDVDVPASLHTEVVVLLNSTQVQQYLAYYPTLNSSALNSHKIAFTSPDTASLSQLVAAFTCVPPTAQLQHPPSALTTTPASMTYVTSPQYGQDSCASLTSSPPMSVPAVWPSPTTGTSWQLQPCTSMPATAPSDTRSGTATPAQQPVQLIRSMSPSCSTGRRCCSSSWTTTSYSHRLKRIRRNLPPLQS